MKKFTKTFLAILLVFMQVLCILPAQQLVYADDSKVTVTFYDKDGTTVIDKKTVTKGSNWYDNREELDKVKGTPENEDEMFVDWTLANQDTSTFTGDVTIFDEDTNVYAFYDKDYELVTNSEGIPHQYAYKHKILYCYNQDGTKILKTYYYKSHSPYVSVLNEMILKDENLVHEYDGKTVLNFSFLPLKQLQYYKNLNQTGLDFEFFFDNCYLGSMSESKINKYVNQERAYTQKEFLQRFNYLKKNTAFFSEDSLAYATIYADYSVPLCYYIGQEDLWSETNNNNNVAFSKYTGVFGGWFAGGTSQYIQCKMTLVENQDTLNDLNLGYSFYKDNNNYNKTNFTNDFSSIQSICQIGWVTYGYSYDSDLNKKYVKNDDKFQLDYISPWSDNNSYYNKNNINLCPNNDYMMEIMPFYIHTYTPNEQYAINYFSNKTYKLNSNKTNLIMAYDRTKDYIGHLRKNKLPTNKMFSLLSDEQYQGLTDFYTKANAVQTYYYFYIYDSDNDPLKNKAAFVSKPYSINKKDLVPSVEQQNDSFNISYKLLNEQPDLTFEGTSAYTSVYMISPESGSIAFYSENNKEYETKEVNNIYFQWYKVTVPALKNEDGTYNLDEDGNKQPDYTVKDITNKDFYRSYSDTTLADVKPATAPEKDGYDFVGWSLDGTEENILNDDDKVIPGLKFYPIYEERKTFKATFKNGEEVLSEKEYPFDTTFADIEKPETPTKASDEQYDYTFNGWKVDDKFVTEDKSFNQDVVFQADFTAKEKTITPEPTPKPVSPSGLTVTFKVQNSEDIVKTSVVSGSALGTIKPENPTIDGKTFKGWKFIAFYDSATPNEKGVGDYEIKDDDFIITTNMLFVAEFEDNATEPVEPTPTPTPVEPLPRPEPIYPPVLDTRFSVKYVDDSGNTIKEVKVEPGATIGNTKPVMPDKDGFTFIGWSVNDKIVDDSYVINTDTVFKAEYKTKIFVKIEGTIKDKNGNPISDAIVTLHSDIRTTKTDENGHYVFENVALEEHTIEAMINDKIIYQYTIDAKDVESITKTLNQQDANYTINADIKKTDDNVIVEIDATENSTNNSADNSNKSDNNPKDSDKDIDDDKNSNEDNQDKKPNIKTSKNTDDIKDSVIVEVRHRTIDNVKNSHESNDKDKDKDISKPKTGDDIWFYVLGLAMGTMFLFKKRKH